MQELGKEMLKMLQLGGGLELCGAHCEIMCWGGYIVSLWVCACACLTHCVDVLVWPLEFGETASKGDEHGASKC